ncbi:hypothetical protein [Herbiconiux sp. YIM B11900]|uniref:hypothetical protein n=1 Tax=Herbiconiux sp. YIM B11900 TaxID=3404131 RepID=UPI003F8668EF
MSIPEFDPERRLAFRRLLSDSVEDTPRPLPRSRSHRRPRWTGIAAFVLAGVLTGGAVSAAATTFRPEDVASSSPAAPDDASATASARLDDAVIAVGLRGVPAPDGVSPGSPIISMLGSAETFQLAADGSSPYAAPAGSGWTALFPFDPPEGATHVRVSFLCLSAGTTRFGQNADHNNGSSGCDGPGAGSFSSYGDYPLDAGLTLYIDADPGASSIFTIQYVNHVETAWGINAAGETYGIMNKPGAGEPDLIAASGSASNGERGYIRRTELEAADGTAAMQEFSTAEDVKTWQDENAGVDRTIPLYESDGVTQIGRFLISG